MGKPQTTVEVEQKVVEMYQSGVSGTVVAKRLFISAPTVYSILERYGIQLRPDPRANQRKIKVEQHKDVLKRYADGASLNQIGREFDCALETIRYILKSHGVVPRKRGATFVEVSDESVEEIVRLYQQEGLAQQTIANRFGLTQGNISRLLRKHGIKPKPRFNSGARHGSWKGGRVELGNGYIGIRLAVGDPLNCMAHQAGYVQEHRLVMARALGRPLSKSETVHHINGDKSDNRLENLQIRMGKHGDGQVFQCADCGSFHIVAVELATED